MTAFTLATWHGSGEELRRLERAITAHCLCVDGLREICPHRLLGDQRVLDHLLYGYRTRARFIEGEWSRNRIARRAAGRRGP